MTTRMYESKTFDTSTLAGLKSAERFKTRMENKYENVTTVSKGLFGVVITGRNHNGPADISQAERLSDLSRVMTFGQ